VGIPAVTTPRHKPRQRHATPTLAVPAGGVTGFTLNPALRSYLLDRVHATEPGKTPLPPQPTSALLRQRRQLRDRLSEQDLSTLVEALPDRHTRTRTGQALQRRRDSPQGPAEAAQSTA
jgi:hypothetical protein